MLKYLKPRYKIQWRFDTVGDWVDFHQRRRTLWGARYLRKRLVVREPDTLTYFRIFDTHLGVPVE